MKHFVLIDNSYFSVANLGWKSQTNTQGAKAVTEDPALRGLFRNQ